MQGDLLNWGELLTHALVEDGAQADITSQAAVDESATLTCQFVAREPLVLCGTPALLWLEEHYAFTITLHAKDGAHIAAGQSFATITGNARDVLRTERTALNILQHLSAIATLTKRYVAAIEGTHAAIMDTRKTTPGLRYAEKYAVACGGGKNHRVGLHDQVLIKDNHLALGGNLASAITKAKTLSDAPVIVECDTLAQVDAALDARADILLLDNMPPHILTQAVAKANGRALTEASGGITLANVTEVAHTGVNRISIGALTHSAGSVDIGLDATNA